MLVLSRKKSEQIQIGHNITITVLRVKGAAVQIGIEAPDNVKILRSELSFDPSLGRNDRELIGGEVEFTDDMTLADTLVFHG